MKKLLKVLFLGVMTMGMAVGCDNAEKDKEKETPVPDVVEKQFAGYSLDTSNVKLNYVIGEEVDLTGLKVYKNFSDGTKEEILVYSFTITDNTTDDLTGTKTCTVMIDGYDTPLSFDFIISEVEKTTWSLEETLFMSAILYGEVLPYTGDETSLIASNQSYTTVYIFGGDASDEALEKYGPCAIHRKTYYPVSKYFTKQLSLDLNLD